MKLKFTLLMGLLVLACATYAQDHNNRWSFELGTNGTHFFNESKMEDDFFAELTDANDWDFTPAPSYFKFGYFVGDGVRVTAAFSYNTIDKIDGNLTATLSRPSDLFFLAFDGAIEYDFRYLAGMEEGWFAPYIGTGLGYYNLDNEGGSTFNAGLGFDFYINENVVINVQSLYKHAFESDQFSYTQHVAGVKILFGGKDTDGDGIYDRKDDCPETPGLPEFNGCPDDDLDGIKNSEDDCPQTAGPAENNGCPDSDGDGILDKNDECPDEVGPAYNNGCPDPDSDGDGILDSKDECPNEPGVPEENGCPVKDRDNDGVPDDRDQCPDKAGTMANNGCPEVPTEKEQVELNQYAKTILFDTGKSSIKKESEETMEAIKEILMKYPDAKFTVEGHTDSVGSEKNNQALSDSRANAVRDWLVGHGIDKFRLSATGFGESKPIASNKTKEGRAKNRRVEINLSK
jgi:outer membrane protein OmpA-like peptidoglycan-associated protein